MCSPTADPIPAVRSLRVVAQDHADAPPPGVGLLGSTKGVADPSIGTAEPHEVRQ